MGNKVGFQVDQGSVKIAVLCRHPDDIQFMDKMKSVNKRNRAQLKQNAGVTFFFRYTIQQFLDLKGTDNIKMLRLHFKQELDKPNIDIYMNMQTSLLVESTPVLKEAIKTLLQADFTPKYRQNYTSSVLSLDCLNYFAEESQYFRFSSQIGANQLHLITKEVEYKKQYYPLPGYPYLLGSLRKGALFFKVNSIDNVQKLAGSIIGELTICSILEAITHNKQQDLEEIITKSFEDGNNRCADLLVEDIYGKTFHGLGIDGSVIACSLGKVSHDKCQATQADKFKSLLLAFGVNVAQFLALQMKLLNLKNCVILANKFHNDYFYYTIQSLVAFFQPKAEVLFADLGNFMSCMGNIDFTPS